MSGDLLKRGEVSKDEPEISDAGVWNDKFKGERIPGSSRVPVCEMFENYGDAISSLNVLDVGSGSGRSTEILKRAGVSKITCLDLSLEGLKNTTATDSKVQARAERLPFKEGCFDVINVCGVMTNLVDRDPEKAKKIREEAVVEFYRNLVDGGRLFISDFCADHYLTGYPVNYQRHSLITGEEGTIAVFDPGAKITFSGRPDEEIIALNKSDKLVRFAHHYRPQELIEICQKAGFSIEKYSIEVGITPSGNPIENIIVVARK